MMLTKRQSRTSFFIGFLYGISVLLAAAQPEAETSGAAYAGPDYSKAKPVELEIVQQKGPMGARFVYPTREGVEIELLEGGGRIVLGWRHMDQFTINVPMTESLRNALAQADPEKRAESLKAEVEPLLPIAAIPESNTNIHSLIDAYLRAVIDTEDWLAAYEISQQMALDLSPATSVRYFYAVAENLFISGEREKALNLLEQLVAARPRDESSRQSLGVARRLLSQRLFEPAFTLFRALEGHSEGLKAKGVLLRCAYLCLELDKANEAENYLAKAKRFPEDDDSTRGAMQIVLGVQAHKNDDPNKALNHLGHGLALVFPNSDLKQVGLYFNFQTYEKLEGLERSAKAEAADTATTAEAPELAEIPESDDSIDIPRNILDEMKLLFPDGAYTAILTKTL